MWPQMPGSMPGGMPGGMPGAMQWQWPGSQAWMPPPNMEHLGGSSSSGQMAMGWGGGRAPGRHPPEDSDDDGEIRREGDVPTFLEPAVEDSVPVPKALLGKVIGKQAQTIIEIREKSGAFKVDARDQTSDPCMVKIAGTAEAVKKARELIMDLIDSTRSKHHGSEFVAIPKSKIGMVIGLKGSQVNDIQCSTNTKIDIEFDADPCRCYIKGLPNDVEAAKKVLLTIAMQIEDDNSEYLDLPKSTSGAIIGAAGYRVREFQEQSGARIDIDKSGAKCRVRITGTKDSILMAKALIQAEIERATPPPGKPMLSIGPAVHQPMVIPSHQPTSFPATLSESIARARAAAQAVKCGLVTNMPPPPPPASNSLGGSW